MRKRGRGAYEELEGVTDGADMRVVKWFDNRCVTIASSCASAQPVVAIHRWNKSTKGFIDVPRPKIVALYNEFMRGVDSLDALIIIIPCRILYQMTQ